MGLTPLDPGWTPDGGMTTSPSAPPATLAPPAVAAPVAPAVAPPVPAPAYSSPLPTVSPSLPPTASPPQAEPQAATAVNSQVEHDTSYARAALEEDSGFEAGLLSELLVECQDSGASDLHLTAGARPTLRVNGSLMAMEDRSILTPPIIQRMMYAILTQKQRERFEEELELDFAFALPGRARFRVNLYRQRDALGGAFRIIPYEIKALEELGVPPVSPTSRCCLVASCW